MRTHAYTKRKLKKKKKKKKKKSSKNTFYLFVWLCFVWCFAAIQNLKLFNHHYFKMVMLFLLFFRLLVRLFICWLDFLFFCWFVGFCCLLFIMSSCLFVLLTPPPHNHFYQVYFTTHMHTHAKSSA